MNEKGKLWLKILAVAAVLVAVIAVVMLVEPFVAADDGTIYMNYPTENKDDYFETVYSGYQFSQSTNNKVDEKIINESVVYDAMPKNPDGDAYVFISLKNQTDDKTYFMGSKAPINGVFDVIAIRLSKVMKLNKTVKEEYLVNKSKECIFLGIMYEKKTDIKMYTNGTILDESMSFTSDYKLVFTTIDFVDKNQDNINDNLTASLPNRDIKGLSFAGWYYTSNFKNGTMSTTNMSETDNGLVYARYISYGDGGKVVVICMAIVFLMLAILYGITSLLKYLAPSAKHEEVKEEEQQVPQAAFSISDITDDDMMAAALVATIDYHNECKKDVRVISIKEIR